MSIFVGREKDLETLNGYLQDALDGNGKVILVTGETGIGKTTLIEEFKRRYIDTYNEFSIEKNNTLDIRFAHAECKELITLEGEAYAPFLNAISDFVSEDKAFGSTRLAKIVQEMGAEWFELIPMVGKALSLLTKTLMKWKKTDDIKELTERNVNKEKLKQQYIQILKNMSELYPLVIFLDDLHWLDEASVNLLFYLSSELQEHRIMILGTYRSTDIEMKLDGEPHPMKEVIYEMNRYNTCKEIHLSFLSEENINRYLDENLNYHELPKEFIDYLYDITEGIPLFLTEYIKLLKEQKSIIKKGDKWILKEKLESIYPPKSVEEVVKKRIQRLNLQKETYKILKYASIEGEQFNTLILAHLLDWKELNLLEEMNTIEEVYELIEELPDEEILFEKGTKYQFVHSLVRNTLYDSLRKREKILLHHKIAEILEDLHKDNLDNIAAKLATHYELARDYNKAAYYYSRLAKNDNKKHAIENARKAANKGLELIKKLGRKANIENQIRLLLELGNAEVINGTLTEAAKYFEQVKPLITDKTNKFLSADFYLRLGSLYGNQLELNLAIETLHKALEIYKELGKCLECGEVMLILGGVYWKATKIDEFMELAQEFIDFNEQNQTEEGNIDIFYNMAKVSFYQNDYRKALDYYDKSLELAHCYSNKHREIDILLGQDYAFLRLGKYNNSLLKAQQALQIAKEIGDLYKEAMAFYDIGIVYQSEGKLKLAREYIEKRLQLIKRLGNKNAIASAYNDLAFFIANYEHRMKEGAEKYELSIKIRKEIGYPIALTLGNWTNVIAYLGRFDEALSYLLPLLEKSRQREDYTRAGYTLHHLATIYFAQGKFQLAIEYRSESLSITYKQQDKSRIYHYSLRLAKYFIEIGNLDKAKALIKQSEEYKKDWRLLQKKALLFLYEKNYADTIKLMEEAISLYYKPGQEDILAILNKDLTIAYMHIGNLDKALECALETSNFYEYSGGWSVAEAYIHLARVYLARKDYMNAERYLSVAKKKFDEEYKLPHRFAECKVYEGQMLKMQGKTEEGNKIIRESIKKFEEIGAVRLQRDAEDILNNY